ncbi:MAG TPA: hypothetical protein VL053_02790 [Arachidicoccus sp.]|nr:hypothetical protein [Arachidicoccus sp.]
MYFFLKLSFIVATAIGYTGSKNSDRIDVSLSSMSQYKVPGETRVKYSLPQKDSLTVLLDSYFNNEKKEDKSGKLQPTHYKWDQKDLGGYSLWGAVFKSMGAATRTTFDPPSKKNLSDASIYIITDPDIPSENKDAKYMTKQYADVVANWVAKGGVLVLMTNDSGNADIQHINLLTQHFGFLFNEDSYNHVPGRAFDSGGVSIAEGNMIFKQTRRVYIKELSTIHPTKPVQTILEKNGHIIAVTTSYGKGTIFAVGDPWFYNEYVDGKRLPARLQNVGAMEEFTRWLIQKADNHNKRLR